MAAATPRRARGAASPTPARPSLMAAAAAARAGPATGGRAEHAMAVASRPDPGGRRPAVAARARNLSVARAPQAARTATTMPNPPPPTPTSPPPAPHRPPGHARRPRQPGSAQGRQGRRPARPEASQRGQQGRARPPGWRRLSQTRGRRLWRWPGPRPARARRFARPFQPLSHPPERSCKATIVRTRHDHAPFLAPQRPAVGTPGRFAAGTWHRLRVARRLAADRLWQHPAATLAGHADSPPERGTAGGIAAAGAARADGRGRGEPPAARSRPV